jgi:rSAM/selenodomain-associated transferase 1
MLLDSIAMASSLTGVVPYIFFQDDPGAASYFKALAPEIISTPQTGKNLGERMHSAFSGIFDRGFIQIAIIGTDSPDLPPDYVLKAFSLLESDRTDVVFGPAEDGGYYLLAMKRIWRELFTDLPWSSVGLLAASLARSAEIHLGASVLPIWYDIDTAADLQRAELLDEHNPAVNTRGYLISGLRPGSRPPSDR